MNYFNSSGDSMAQITIRNIPESVERKIRRLAADRRISLSKTAVILLRKALGTLFISRFEEISQNETQ